MALELEPSGWLVGNEWEEDVAQCKKLEVGMERERKGEVRSHRKGLWFIEREGVEWGFS